MARPIDRRHAALARQLTIDAERSARQDAERLSRTEQPGVTRVLTRDLRAGQCVLSESGYVRGVVQWARPARKPHYVVVQWTDGTQWSGSELETHRVAATEEVAVSELREGDVIPSFGSTGGDRTVAAVIVSEPGWNPALPLTRKVTVAFLGGGEFLSTVRADGTCGDRLVRRARG